MAIAYLALVAAVTHHRILAVRLSVFFFIFWGLIEVFGSLLLFNKASFSPILSRRA